MASTSSSNFYFIKLVLSLMILSALLGGPVVALAQTQPDPSGEPYQGQGIVPCTGAEGDECGFYELVELGERIITWLLFIAVFIAAVLFAVAGFLYATSAGDEGKVKKAHTIFRRVLMGFIIALAAWLIVFTITSILLNDENQDLPLLDR
jgi:amino acid transporter